MVLEHDENPRRSSSHSRVTHIGIGRGDGREVLSTDVQDCRDPFVRAFGMADDVLDVNR